MDTLGTGAQVYFLAQSVVDTHQLVQSELVDWASDWSRPDDEINDIQAIASVLSSDVQDEVDTIAGPYAPMIAGISGSLKASKYALKAVKLTARLRKAFTSWLSSGPRNVSVYIGTRNGKPYVGITNSVIRRGSEHGQKLKPLAQNLTRNEARAIETQIIKNNPHFDNTIQSVADNHRFGKYAEDFALTMMKKLGIKLNY